VEIWAEALNLPPEEIGVNDSFFELGGHSLSSVQLMAKIQTRFGRLLPLAAIFDTPTISGLSTLIVGDDATRPSILVPIQSRGDLKPIFAVPGIGGSVVSLQPLTRILGPRQPLYGLQAVGLDGKMTPFCSVEDTAQANIAAIKSVQRVGPHTLIGHSYGGVVAYEMCRILLENSEQIAALILLDSFAPAILREEPPEDEATGLLEVCATIERSYGIHLPMDVNRIRQSAGPENRRYIGKLLNDNGVEISEAQLEAIYAVYRANLLAYRAYRPRKLSRRINAFLYRATKDRVDGLSLPHDYGWNELMESPIHVFDIEATHFSILERVPLQNYAAASAAD
jgi:polyketide synthase PksN